MNNHRHIGYGFTLSLAFTLCMSNVWAAPMVVDLILVSEKRVSRTVFDYTYKVTVKNDTNALTDVVAQAQAAGAGTTILDGTATLASLAANATEVSSDTVIFRHDRTKPFRRDLLVWSITGTPESVGGILMPGDPAASVAEVMPDYDAFRLVPDAEISTDPDSGSRVIRTALYIAFRQDATVADVNAVLNSINGRILSSFAGNGAVSVGIQDPGSLPALYALIADLKTKTAVEIVLPDEVAEPENLPQEVLIDNTMSRLDHHLAVRASAAWNARQAITYASSVPPSLLIYDQFGNGAPTLFYNQINWSASTSFGTSPATHGYHVTGILLGSFGGTGQSGEVTGMYPSGAPIRSLITGYAVDGTQIRTGIKTQMRNVLRAAANNGNVVINTSMSEGMKCNTSVDDDLAKANALFWLRLLRGDPAIPAAIEGKFLHSAAAANNTCRNLNSIDVTKQVGKYAASWTAAALLPHGLLGVPPLANTLVVENRMIEPAIASNNTAQTGCTYDGRYTGSTTNSTWGASYLNGNIGGIGSRNDRSQIGVWSYLDALTPPTTGDEAGTSMATPQVAGLATYLWTLRPSLTGAELAKRIIGHARAPSSCTGPDISSTPVIDAYATILSADIDFSNAPARKAILDVNGDDRFDAADTEGFLNAFYLDSDLNPNPTPGIQADYSRYDLNGDGKTGGAGVEKVNLDMSYDASGISSYTVNPRTDRGYTLKVDENRVTDFDTLCFYVNSSLFPATELPIFESQLENIRAITGNSTISCTNVVGGKITINQSVTGWAGLPGTPSVSNLTAKSIPLFRATGNSSTCGTGERGGPIFSSQVDFDAVFFGAADSFDTPYPISRVFLTGEIALVLLRTKDWVIQQQRNSGSMQRHGGRGGLVYSHTTTSIK